MIIDRGVKRISHFFLANCSGSHITRKRYRILRRDGKKWNFNAATYAVIKIIKKLDFLSISSYVGVIGVLLESILSGFCSCCFCSCFFLAVDVVVVVDAFFFFKKEILYLLLLLLLWLLMSSSRKPPARTTLVLTHDWVEIWWENRERCSSFYKSNWPYRNLRPLLRL